MTIHTWSNFTKRRNSTKKPTGGTPVTAVLKEGTSVENPTFLLNSNDFSINYVTAFNHCYFVDDITSVRNNLIEVKCSMDVGATYKSAIQSYKCMVERSYTYHNPMIADPYVTVFNDEVVTENVLSGGSIFNSGGFFVLSVLNDVGSGAGFTTYYVMDASGIKALAQYVNVDWGNGLTDIVDWLEANFLRTADAIIDCIWLPYSYTFISALTNLSYETVKIGVDVVSGVSGYRFQGTAVSGATQTITIPHQYTDFRKGAPYTICHLFIPGYGTVEVNPLDFDDDKIRLRIDADIATGDMIAYLKDSNGSIISSYKYNVAVPCPVGKIASNVSGTTSGILSTAGSLAGALLATNPAGAVGSGIAAAASGINTAASAVAPTLSVNGGRGGRAIASDGLDIKCTCICKVTSDPDELLETIGRPWMRESTLTSFSGYVKCVNAEVPIAGMESDKEQVNNLLNSGFYLE